MENNNNNNNVSADWLQGGDVDNIAKRESFPSGELVLDNAIQSLPFTKPPHHHQVQDNVRHQARLLYRNAPFFQSAGKVNIRHYAHVDDWVTRRNTLRVMLVDWFHLALSIRTTWLIVLLAILYTLLMVTFMGIYTSIAHVCANAEYNGKWTFQMAFAFSLETTATVGYTLPFDNSVMFFGGCLQWDVAVYFQIIIMIVLRGVTIGIFMMRVQRADRRSNLILFSRLGCIFCVQGTFYFSLQIFDLYAKRPLLNTSVKLLAQLHDFDPSRNEDVIWQTRTMRITRPDDEIGSKIWLSIPAVIVHEIDAWSALAPSFLTMAPPLADTVAPNRFPHPAQRDADGMVGSYYQSVCPVCGIGLANESTLRKHLAYVATEEAAKGRGVTFGHRAITIRNATRPVVVTQYSMLGVGIGGTGTFQEFVAITPERAMEYIRRRFEQRRIEVVVLVEGTDPRTSNAFQARHTYATEDIAWGKQHAPCVHVGTDGAAEINLSLFHEVVDISADMREPFPLASES